MTKDRIIRILGVPFNGDGTTPAEENPAAALRTAGITDFRSALNLKVEDLGDIEIPGFSGIRDPDTSILNFNAWEEISRRTAERVKSKEGVKSPISSFLLKMKLPAASGRGIKAE